MHTNAASTTRSHAPRYLFLFLLGLVAGIIGTVMAMRALDARKDHFPDALMHVQGWHTGQLKAGIDSNRCAASDAQPHLEALRAMSNNLEPAFPDLAEDERFSGHARDMRATLDAAIASPPQDCTEAAATLEQVGNACKACHQDFRT